MSTSTSDGHEAAVKTMSVETTAEAEMLNASRVPNGSRTPARRSARRTTKTVQKTVRKPLENDRFIYRAVVLVLGSVMVIGAGGSITLAIMSGAQEAPTLLVALGSAAVGAVGGLLAPSPQHK